jgi:hypothetical protein
MQLLVIFAFAPRAVLMGKRDIGQIGPKFSLPKKIPASEDAGIFPI